MTTLHAQPYDLAASGFYFDSAESYAAQAATLRNDYGQRVEEFEIQFIDGETLDAQLFAALSVNQANLGAFFEAVAAWDDDQKIKTIIAVGELGYRFDLGRDDPDRFDIDLYQVDSLRDLAVQFVITNGTYWCSRMPSVFSYARGLGVNTAVIGWYVPYAKLFGKDLNYCSWYPLPLYEPYEPTHALTFGAAMWQQIQCLAGPLHVRQAFVDMYHQSLAESTSLVTNSTYGLVLLHMFPPHAPGIYLRDKDQFTVHNLDKVGGYFNNLALADRTLGQLRQALISSGKWDTTWIIVSADHSWRDAANYDGRRDYRVPFLVNPPGPNGPMVYTQAFNTVATRFLIQAILRGEITNTTQSVADWLQANAPARATVPGTLIEAQ